MSIFVGIGFGPIQTGVFLSEAQRCGRFDRLVVAEIDDALIAGLRDNGGKFALNIAESDSVRRESIENVEVLDPRQSADREVLVQAIACASELATAIPSVRFYRGEGPGSPHRLIAEALNRRSTDAPLIIYTAENDNHAAEQLEAAVAEFASRENVAKARFLNTVIGKMSAVIDVEAEIAARSLIPLAPSIGKAHLVEAFRRILISDPGADVKRSIDAFESKSDLLPFEEAKLYGHNATHALAAYLGETVSAVKLSEISASQSAVSFLRGAFIEESGAALIAKYGGADPLFSPEGYRAYAEDLIERMLNPHLGDLVERVGRDPQRKLGWNDRLVGTMRLAFAAGIEPQRYALGAAAALDKLLLSGEASGNPNDILRGLWGRRAADEAEVERLISLVAAARPMLDRLRVGGWSVLERV